MAASATSRTNGKTFLEILPPEIRKWIFRYVTQSSNGRVTFKRVSLPSRTPAEQYMLQQVQYCPETYAATFSPMSLSFLRTCKQVYNEGWDAIWDDNILDVPSSMAASEIPNPVKARVKSLELFWDYLDETRNDGHLSLVSDLVGLEAMPELRRLTIRGLCSGIGDRFRHLQVLIYLRQNLASEVVDSPELFAEHLDAFRTAFRAPSPDDIEDHGPLSHLQRQLIFQVPKFEYQETSNQHRLFVNVGNPNDMFTDFCKAIDGPVCLGDILVCDGKIKEKTLFYKTVDNEEFVCYHYIPDLAVIMAAKDCVDEFGCTNGEEMFMALEYQYDTLIAYFNDFNEQVYQEVIRRWGEEKYQGVRQGVLLDLEEDYGD